MRGADVQQLGMFSYVSVEGRVPSVRIPAKPVLDSGIPRYMIPAHAGT
jgi:hypothetical protein